jgi:hypothetical protein
MDLVVSISDEAYVNLLLGNGDGTFQAAVPFATGSLPLALVVADFNADGNPDSLPRTAAASARRPSHPNVLL